MKVIINHSLKLCPPLQPIPVDADECRKALEDGDRLCLVNEACVNREGSYECVCAPGLLFIYDDIDTSYCGSE